MANRPVKIQTVEVPTTAPKISPTTITSIILYAIVLINQVAATLGFHFNLKADEATVYEVVSAAFTLIAFGHAWWRNNNITKAARIKAAVANQVVVEDPSK